MALPIDFLLQGRGGASLTLLPPARAQLHQPLAIAVIGGLLLALPLLLVVLPSLLRLAYSKKAEPALAVA